MRKVFLEVFDSDLVKKDEFMCSAALDLGNDRAASSWATLFGDGQEKYSSGYQWIPLKKKNQKSGGKLLVEVECKKRSTSDVEDLEYLEQSHLMTALVCLAVLK